MDIFSHILQANNIIDFTLKIAFYSLLVGVVSGFINGTVGGGGLITYPVLTMMGIPPHISLATSKLQGMFGIVSGAWHFYKKGMIDIKKYFPVAFVLTIIWSIVGVMVLKVTPSTVLQKIIPIIMIAIFLYRIFNFKSGLHQSPKPLLKNITFVIIFTALLGFYDGFFGPGLGTLWIFALVTFAGMNSIQASANSNFLNFASNIGSIPLLAFSGLICYKVGITMGIGQVIGAKIGVHFSIKHGAKFVNILFLMVLFAMITRMVFQYYL